MGQACTYIWTDPKDGTIRYVGKGKNLRRAWSHILPSAKSTRLTKMLRKRIREGYEPSPKMLIAEDDADAKEMEMLLIAMIGREDLGKGPLFNLTDGGDGSAGHKQSEATKKKRSLTMLNMGEIALSNIKKGNQNRSTSTYEKAILTKKVTGKLVRSEDCKKKISAKLSGKIKSDQHLEALATSRALRTSEKRAEIGLKISTAASKVWEMQYEDGRPSTTILNLNKWCKLNPEYNFSSTRRTAHHGKFYKGVRVTQITCS